MTLLELLVEKCRKHTWGWAKAARWAKGRQDVVAWRIIDEAEVDFIANSSGEKVTKEQYEEALAATKEQKMKYEYLKGSEKDFEGAPEWATYLAELAKNKSIAWVSSDDNKYKYKFDSTNSQSGMSFEGKFINFMWEDRIEIIAERRQITEPLWDGAGLPPVGCECEVLYDTVRDEWFLAKIIGHDNGSVVGRWLNGDGLYSLFDYSHASCSFRPIRTEADKKRDAVIEFITGAIDSHGVDPLNSAKFIYDAIASGKIPGVKLED